MASSNKFAAPTIDWKLLHRVLTQLYMHMDDYQRPVASARSSYAVNFLKECVRINDVPAGHLQNLFQLMPADIINSDIEREYHANTPMDEIINDYMLPLLKTAAEESKTIEMRAAKAQFA